ncbi:hypothetical protein DFH09DRAFT_1186069 [Mycena vulgaris]|nr:hypothetical protein DFH09DRAFT_1186069 [Mycena vulgaris]
MAMNVAIVDDSDPLIRYAGSWSAAGSSVEFNKTTKVSRVQGSTAIFSFVGTSIVVYGSVGPSDLNSPLPSMSFSVDGSVIGSYTAPDLTSSIHHEALWASPTMKTGSHTLVITQTAAQAGAVIFLDYIQYNTTSTDVEGAYFIDDRDPRVTYTPRWRPFGSDNDFQHTSQESTLPGDSFSLAFEGTSVSYYGGLSGPSNGVPMNASIILDGAPPLFIIGPINPPPATNNLIYKSDELPPGPHTLVVTGEGRSTLWTDYFLVTPSRLSTSPTSETPSTSTSSAASPSSTIAPKTSTPVAAIVGATLGVVVLLSLAVLAVVLVRRRQRRREYQPEAPRMQPVVTPYGYAAASLAPRTTPASNIPRETTMSLPAPFQNSKYTQEMRRQAVASRISPGASTSEDVPPGYSE